MRHVVIAAVLYLCLQSGRAEEVNLKPGYKGPVELTLADQQVVHGTLTELSKDALFLDTSDGKRIIQRSQVKTINATDAEVANAANSEVEPPLPLIKRRDGASKNGGEDAKLDAADAALLSKLKSDGMDRVTAPTPATAAEPANFAQIDLKNTRSFEDVMKLINARQYRLAGSVARRIVTNGTEEEVAKVAAACKQNYQMSLSEFIAMCMLNDKCEKCTAGAVCCPACAGTGYNVVTVKHVPGRESNEDYYGGIGMVDTEGGGQHRFVRLCATCRGNGYDRCGACFGTALKFNLPSPYERDDYVKQLLKRAEQTLYTSESSYAETGRDAPPSGIVSDATIEHVQKDGAQLKPMLEQVWLRDTMSKTKSDIMRMWRAEAYYEFAMKADPALAIRPNQDIPEKVLRIFTRRQHLYGELFERQQSYTFNWAEILASQTKNEKKKEYTGK